MRRSTRSARCRRSGCSRSSHRTDHHNSACQRWRSAAFLLFGRCRCERAGVADVVPGSRDPAVGTLDVGDAEPVDMAVEGIGDAAHVPPDPKGRSITRYRRTGCAACGAEPNGIGYVAEDDADRRALAAQPKATAPLSRLAVRPHDPRQEPAALAADAGSCGGQQSPSLPRAVLTVPGRVGRQSAKRSSIRTSSGAGHIILAHRDRTGGAAGPSHSNGARRPLERCAHHGCVDFTRNIAHFDLFQQLILHRRSSTLSDGAMVCQSKRAAPRERPEPFVNFGWVSSPCRPCHPCHRACHRG
jgi:hypothetical protein